MAAIGDIVTLNDGSVGVVGEEVPSPGAQIYRVHFNNSHLTVTDADIASTLEPPVYEVGDAVSLWPYSGTIAAIDGDEYTLSIERQETLDFGPITWTGTYKAPFWRLACDNDSRISRQ